MQSILGYDRIEMNARKGESNMNEVQKIQLGILMKLDEVCQEHNLRYYLACGTCIGAIREKGFIPWDHDIDVMMPVDEAFKLEEYQDDFKPRFFLRSYRTDPSYGATNMRVADTTHTGRIIIKGKVQEESNISIDIYLLYNCPKGRVVLLANIWRSYLYKMLVGGPPKNHGELAKAISRILIWLFGGKKKAKRISKIEERLNYKGESEELCTYYGEDISLCSVIKYKKEWFGEPKRLDFEGYKFNGPTYPDKYLAKRYGDYMTPTPVEKIDKEARLELIN